MKRVVTTASGLALAFAVSVAAQSGSTSGTQGTSGSHGTADQRLEHELVFGSEHVEQQRELEDCHGHRVSAGFGQQLDADERLDERRLGSRAARAARAASGTGSSGSGSTAGAGTTSGSGSTTGTGAGTAGSTAGTSSTGTGNTSGTSQSGQSGTMSGSAQSGHVRHDLPPDRH